MACKCIGNLCNHFIISQSVTFTDGTLIIDLPAGNYENGEKYCIVVAQEIPVETTIAADVAITIGGVATPTYPLVNNNCTNVQACGINSRTRYATKVATNIGEGVFKLLCDVNCYRNNAAPSLPIQEVTTTGG
jgi:hypothetical protein